MLHECGKRKLEPGINHVDNSNGVSPTFQTFHFPRSHLICAATECGRIVDATQICSRTPKIARGAVNEHAPSVHQTVLSVNALYVCQGDRDALGVYAMNHVDGFGACLHILPDKEAVQSMYKMVNAIECDPLIT